MPDASKPLWLNQEKPKEEPKDIFLCVGTPVHSEASIHYTQCVLELQKYFFKQDISTSFIIHKSSLVTQGRNLTVSSFLETNGTHLLFLDSDIFIDPETIHKMIKSDKDIICVPYPLKSMQWGKILEKFNKGKIKTLDDLKTAGCSYPVRLEDSTNITVHNGITEITHAPAGCLLIKRSVFETLMNKFPDLKINQQSVINGEYVEKPFYYNFFDCVHDKETKTYMGEDFGFCRLWKSIGGKLFGLIDAPIMHVGEHQYIGRFADEFEPKED